MKPSPGLPRASSGIKLPDEFNYMKIFQQIAARPQLSQAMNARERLAQIFENRRQYDRAARPLEIAHQGLSPRIK